MILFKAKTRYRSGKVKNIPFVFYIIAENEEAGNKILLRKMQNSPLGMDDWVIENDLDKIAQVEEWSEGNVLIL